MEHLIISLSVRKWHFLVISINCHIQGLPWCNSSWGLQWQRFKIYLSQVMTIFECGMCLSFPFIAIDSTNYDYHACGVTQSWHIQLLKICWCSRDLWWRFKSVHKIIGLQLWSFVSHNKPTNTGKWKASLCHLFKIINKLTHFLEAAIKQLESHYNTRTSGSNQL